MRDTTRHIGNGDVVKRCLVGWSAAACHAAGWVVSRCSNDAMRPRAWMRVASEEEEEEAIGLGHCMHSHLTQSANKFARDVCKQASGGRRCRTRATTHCLVVVRVE